MEKKKKIKINLQQREPCYLKVQATNWTQNEHLWSVRKNKNPKGQIRLRFNQADHEGSQALVAPGECPWIGDVAPWGAQVTQPGGNPSCWWCQGWDVESRGHPVPGSAPGRAGHRGWHWTSFRVPSTQTSPGFHSRPLGLSKTKVELSLCAEKFTKKKKKPQTNEEKRKKERFKKKKSFKIDF